MSIVRRFGLESPEELVLGRREGDGCSDASTDSSDFSATSSSSIGRDSDASGRLSDDEDGGENEVQSHRLCEQPLDMMESMEEALPLRRGISKFYDGKCKSFTTISNAASTSSIKDIAKSENAYTRKRRNLLAFSHIWEKKSRTISRRNTAIGISKRPISSSRSTLALAVAMSSCDSISSQDSNSRSPPLPSSMPLTSSGNNYLASLMMHHPPYNFSTWGSRSISVTDLQRCAPSATLNTSN